MKPRRFAAAAVLFCLILPGTVLAQVQLANSVSLSADYDDNVFNAADHPEDDFLLRLFYSLDLDYPANKANLLYFRYRLGAKKYLNLISEDALINLGQFGYEYRGFTRQSVGAEVEAKLRNTRSTNDDYYKLIATGHWSYNFPMNFLLRLQGVYSQFDYRRYHYFDYWSQQYSLDLRKYFGYEFSAGFDYALQNKQYPTKAYTNIGSKNTGQILALSTRNRVDNEHDLTALAEYSGWLLAKFSYTFQINDSNSYGESYYNHRLVLALSKGIFKRTNVHLLGILQFAKSRDRVLLPHVFQIEEEDEDLSSVAFKVSQGILDWLSIEAQYSRYWDQLGYGRPVFQKDLYSLGVSMKF